jgi:radical SAM superfamily enzyme YgiQ (UPF0313 family)
MNILLVNVPSRRGKGGFTLPLGLLYVGGIVERCGHRARIFDPYLYDADLGDDIVAALRRTIEDFNPRVVGFGGISTSYGRAKELSASIRRDHPEMVMIAGGALSSVADLLLTKTDVDVVFHGETETSLPAFLDSLEKGTGFAGLTGISYRSAEGVVGTPPVEQIGDLDTIPFPAYHLVELDRYFTDVNDWLASYEVNLENLPGKEDILRRIEGKRRYIPIVSSRGCTHRCLFCYRHMKGHRQNTVGYTMAHMKFLRDHYGVEGFQFCDELFNAKRSWVMDFCDGVERENPGVFYLIGGARVDRVDEEMLLRLKGTGCIEINYGQESGSDAILKEYRKGTTGRQNRDVTILTTKKVGLACPVQIVIGSPGETNETIEETIDLLKAVEAYQYSINYLIALPGTPAWDVVEDRGLVPDVEAYLDEVADVGGAPLINLTSVPDDVWRGWASMIRREMSIEYVRRKGLKVHDFVNMILIPLTPRWLKNIIKPLRGLYGRG